MKRVIGRHKAFLAAFALTGSITKAAKAARVDRGQHYEWLRERPGYREAFAEATDQAADLFEDEAKRRAHAGVFEPNVYQGQFCYDEKIVRTPLLDESGNQKVSEGGVLMFDEKTVRGKKPLGIVKYSDSLLMFLLKGLRPDKFRDRVSTEVTGKDGGPISLEEKRLATLTDDQLTQLIAITKALATVAPDGSGTTAPRPE